MGAGRNRRKWSWLEDLGHDARYACRGLARTPGFLLVALVSKDTAGLVAIGLALGLPAAAWAERLAASIVPMVAESNAFAIGAAVAAMAGVALVAGAGPARRAARVQPIDALRHD